MREWMRNPGGPALAGSVGAFQISLRREIVTGGEEGLDRHLPCGFDLAHRL